MPPFPKHRCQRFSWTALALTFAITVSFWLVAHAAELDGVQFPETQLVDGKTLHLNGYGLRAYSILGIHIYVAGLYVERLSTDPVEIIRSSETKLVTVRFERNVSADDARNAWRDSLANNCLNPCHLAPEDVLRFLAMVPAMHKGDSYALLFTQSGATVTVNGQQIGTLSQRQFIIAEFVAHDSRLRLRSLNHLSGGAINLSRAYSVASLML
jgi:Chalcone isomerase-like